MTQEQGAPGQVSGEWHPSQRDKHTSKQGGTAMGCKWRWCTTDLTSLVLCASRTPPPPPRL